MGKVRARIKELRLSDSEAARSIGVTPVSLARHLSGDYVRSDSVAKYRRWLSGDGDAAPARQRGTAQAHSNGTTAVVPGLTGPELPPARPHRVVDLFGGCGGLSLGFELAGQGKLFRTVLSIDIEEAMVRVFNANRGRTAAGVNTGREGDLAEFLNEAEVLAYYLDHLAAVESDHELALELDALKPIGLAQVLRLIQGCDSRFVEALAAVRGSPQFARAYASVPKASLAQTSVLGFHAALKLPTPGTGKPCLGPLLWRDSARHTPVVPQRDLKPGAELIRQCEADAGRLWDSEIKKLRVRAQGAGSGQLASAAKKIAQSLTLVDGVAYAGIRASWLEWRAARDAIRRSYFGSPGTLAQLRVLYDQGRAVEVLLGGPPCQGFSRIGRGKIRSLREQSVHVQSDAVAGDTRNELMLQYVLFVAALSPQIFLFENVRHFQAEVNTPDGTFKATDVLAEAIADISRKGLSYDVASRVLFASEHLIPQTRERFFMVGVRADVEAATSGGAAARCLTLPTRESVPLKHALAGLPEPVYASASAENPGGTDSVCAVQDLRIHGDGSVGEYLEWIRQAPPPDRPNHTRRSVDAHCTRDTRVDDRAFFALLGPGKRWMDYRCDENPLILDLARVLAEARPGKGGCGLTSERLRELRAAVDGSLSLRLLLESVPLQPGEVAHHLCSPNYLKKREGSHGDWLARLDAESPSKTMVSHMGKDTYAYIHPSSPRTISLREAARVQSFPDWYQFGSVGLVDGYRIVGNAVPPLLSSQLALRVAVVLHAWLVGDRVAGLPARQVPRGALNTR